MKSGDIQLNKADVTLVPIEPEMCDACEERLVTHCLQIDLRAVGSTVHLGGDRFCLACGREELALIQASMPEPLNEDGTF